MSGSAAASPALHSFPTRRSSDLTGTITIAATGASNSPQTVTVTFVVAAATTAPTLRVDGSTSSSRASAHACTSTTSGYPPRRTVTRTISPAVNGSTTLTPTLSAD